MTSRVNFEFFRKMFRKTSKFLLSKNVFYMNKFFIITNIKVFIPTFIFSCVSMQQFYNTKIIKLSSINSKNNSYQDPLLRSKAKMKLKNK